eukprot:3048773-Prymnesium_polylepis.1
MCIRDRPSAPTSSASSLRSTSTRPSSTCSPTRTRPSCPRGLPTAFRRADRHTHTHTDGTI